MSGFVRNLLRELYLKLVGQRLEQFGYTAEEFRRIGLHSREFHFVAFVFAQVEDLFQQGLQCPRIAVDEFQSVARRFPDMRIQEQLFDGAVISESGVLSSWAISV